MPWDGAAAVRQRYHDLFTEVSYFTLEDHAVFREYLEKKLIRRQVVGWFPVLIEWWLSGTSPVGDKRPDRFRKILADQLIP